MFDYNTINVPRFLIYYTIDLICCCMSSLLFHFHSLCFHHHRHHRSSFVCLIVWFHQYLISLEKSLSSNNSTMLLGKIQNWKSVVVVWLLSIIYHVNWIWTDDDGLMSMMEMHGWMQLSFLFRLKYVHHSSVVKFDDVKNWMKNFVSATWDKLTALRWNVKNKRWIWNDIHWRREI